MADKVIPSMEVEVLKAGADQNQAMLKVQKELLDAYEKANQAWLARMRSEVEFWSALAAELSSTRSASETLGTHRESVAKRIQLASDNGTKLMSDFQKIAGDLTRSLRKGGNG